MMKKIIKLLGLLIIVITSVGLAGGPRQTKPLAGN